MAGPRFVIRPYHPVRTVLVSAGGIALALLACAWAYWEGSRGSTDELSELREAVAEQRRQLDESDRGNRELREHLWLAQRSAQVDREAVTLTRAALDLREDEVLDLQRAIGFYRSVLAGDNKTNRLAIHSLRLKTNGERDREFDVEVVLTRFLNAEEVIEGTVELTVVAMPHGDRAPGRLETVLLPFRLKHFQRIQGRLSLPDDFLPAEILVQAVAQDRERTLRVERVFDWAKAASG